ncbi:MULTISPECIES: DNA glycosylase AlkZ-like family protein [Phenylobacterium]|uniref:Winged helix DNA-binding domain-containing protein n=1 Tax=Phenylobacterium koreense TaxID=266125 RepID=A0ABV2EL65_9CAUL
MTARDALRKHHCTGILHPMAEDLLTPRDLNRILLARQMLLERAELAPVEALEQLFAVQAQLPRAPFLGLWARLKGFSKADLRKAIEERKVVRSTLMRGTLHLAASGDVLTFRTTIMPPRDVTLPGSVRPTPELLDKVLSIGRQHFAETPQDFESIRQVLEAEGVEPVRPLAYAVRIFLPLVQAAAETEFGHEPGGRFVMAKAWLGEDEQAEPQAAALARRYLASHGPALPADFAAWSGLKGAAATFEALGDDLVRFRDGGAERSTT